jgi:hypothetical protein
MARRRSPWQSVIRGEAQCPPVFDGVLDLSLLGLRHADGVAAQEQMERRVLGLVHLDQRACRLLRIAGLIAVDALGVLRLRGAGFSREYARLFGLPPRSDTKRLLTRPPAKADAGPRR